MMDDHELQNRIVKKLEGLKSQKKKFETQIKNKKEELERIERQVIIFEGRILTAEELLSDLCGESNEK